MSDTAASALPTEEDYRRYDRIWRKVSPEYDPYPEVRAAQSEEVSDGSLLTLPGAAADPCCMGSAAQSEIEVLQGFLREEMADARIYRHLADRAATPEARRVLRAICMAETRHVRTLQSANFLITGERYRVTVVLPPLPKLGWCDTLRARYHEEACDGFNYERASEETTDFCLKKIFAELSREEYRHAELLRQLLARML